MQQINFGPAGSNVVKIRSRYIKQKSHSKQCNRQTPTRT